MAGGIFLLVIGLLVAFVVGYLVYIEIVVPPWYQAQKDQARKNSIRKAKIWETKRRKSSLR